MSKPYRAARDTVESGLGRAGRAGRALVNAGEAAKASIKKLVVPGMFFEDMGIKYIGPIDGHNLASLEETLQAACGHKGPVLIHTVTQKGRGFAPAEQKPEVYHGIGRYDPDTGELLARGNTAPTYTEVFGAALLAEAAVRPELVAITAGMASGTGLLDFKRRYPQRFIDVGIAEEHGVALAAGLALGAKRPVVAIYSTFLQRAFDQVLIDVALQRLPVVFCVDRAGLVGEDGSTHHGAFDLAYLRSIPHMRIIAPYTPHDLRRALTTALEQNDGPVAIRYPRGKVSVEATKVAASNTLASVANGATTSAMPGASVPDILATEAQGAAVTAALATEESGAKEDLVTPLPLGRAHKLRAGGDVALLALGGMVPVALDAAEELARQGVLASVYDMLWVKPLDAQAVHDAAACTLVLTLEDGVVQGGFGSAVLESLALQGLTPRVHCLGLPDRFIDHGSQEQLFAELGLTGGAVANTVLQKLHETKTKTHAKTQTPAC